MRREVAKLDASGSYREALYLHAQRVSACPREFTFPPLLKACGKLRSAPQAQILHTHLVKTGFSADVYSATALTDACMKLRFMEDALKVFEEMPERNLASLNAVITGFLKNGYCREALRLFKNVGIGGFKPNSVTKASMILACGSAEHGVEMHCLAVKLGIESDVDVATSVLTMYSNRGELVSAAKVFEEMPTKNVVSYNAFVSGLLQNGVPRVVLDVFKKIRGCSENPNSVTLISVVSACASLSYLRFGKQVHGLIVKIKIGLDVVIGTALVDMHSKCGRWQLAYAIFKELDEKRNLFTWNAMIAGMILNAQAENAAELFEQLEFEGFEPDSVTWNSMISGFSQLGKGIEAFKCFKRMQSAGEVPGLKSIASLLPACADLSALHCGKEVHGHAILAMICSFHTGLVEKGWQVFRMMNKDFGLKPNPKHLGCMVDLLGRTGRLDEARELIEELPEPSGAVFDSLLGACECHLDSELGKEVATKLSELEPENPAPFVILSKLYAALGRWEDAEKIRGLMNDKTRRKLPGFSLLRLHEK